jgi:hypothetical protein
MPEGVGRYEWSNGDLYIGKFDEEGLLHDKNGYWSTKDGERYYGDFCHWYWEGQGTYVWPTGEIHIGLWRLDKPAGQGLRIFPDGTRVVADFSWEPEVEPSYYNSPARSVFPMEYRRLVVFSMPDGTRVWERWCEGRRAVVKTERPVAGIVQ